MPSRTAVRNLVLGGVAALAVGGLGMPAAGADPSDSCNYYADCNAINGHISRDTVINRAMKWVAAGYTYSQSAHVNGTGENGAQSWRQDCSGLVSMAWRLSGKAPNYGLNTSSLQSVSSEISFLGLRRGDILDDPTGNGTYDAHVVIFDGWVGAAGGDFFMIEENPSYGGAIRHKASTVTYLQVEGIKGRDDNGNNFIPRHYNNLSDN